MLQQVHHQRIVHGFGIEPTQTTGMFECMFEGDPDSIDRGSVVAKWGINSSRSRARVELRVSSIYLLAQRNDNCARATPLPLSMMPSICRNDDCIATSNYFTTQFTIDPAFGI